MPWSDHAEEGKGGLHVSRIIAGGSDNWSKHAALGWKVGTCCNDRHACLKRNLVESRFPLRGPRTCAFGRNDQNEVLTGIELCDDLAD